MKDRFGITKGGSVHAGISFSLLLFCERADTILNVFKRAQVPRLDVLRVLEGDDVCSAECAVAYKIPPHLRFDIESLNGVVRENITCILQCHNMRVVRKDLECNWIHHFPLVILCEV